MGGFKNFELPTIKNYLLFNRNLQLYQLQQSERQFCVYLSCGQP